MVGKYRVMSIPEASLTKERVFNPYHVKTVVKLQLPVEGGSGSESLLWPCKLLAQDMPGDSFV
jgi:hypothetical protein